MRVTDKALLLQTQAVGIMGALGHASQQHSMPNVKFYLLTSVLTVAQKVLVQGRRIINLVPSHIGIRGNQLADRIVETNRGMSPNPPKFHPR